MRQVVAIGALVFIVSEYSIAQTTFQKAFIDTVAFGTASTSVLIENDGYIIAAWGYTEQAGNVHFRSGIHLLKTDFQGNLLWKKKYAQPGKGISNGLYGSLQPTTGGYLMCGNLVDTATRNSDFFLCKIDTAGEVEWLKPYGVSNRVETTFHGSKTSDGGYIMVGERFIQGNGTSSDYYAVRTDSLGNLIWQRTYGGSLNDIGRKIHQLMNGNFIVSGTSESFGPGGFDLWLFETDTNGTIQWEQTYGTIMDDRLRYISLATDGGYYGWGRLDTVINNTEDAFAAMVMKLDNGGNVIWRTFFNHKKELIISQLRELDNGNIVAIGEREVGSADSTAAWIAKLNSSGDILWERQYINNFYEGATYSKALRFNGDFQPTDDGGFIIAGALWKATESFPNIRFDNVWLVKLDSNGCFGADSCGLAVGGIEEHLSLKEKATVVVYPNPFTVQARVSVKADSRQFANQEITFRLFDVSGKQVQTQKHFLNEHGYAEFFVERNQMTTGIYFFKVMAQKSELGNGKLVMQ